MTYESFLILVETTRNDFPTPKHTWAINELIPPYLRLAIALRYFAGASMLDNMIIHGVSYSAAYMSIWIVIDIINHGILSKTYTLSYPNSFEVQQTIALGFKAKSQPSIPCCAGAIDGMLIWTDKRTKIDCGQSQVGSAKFYCSRKAKYGLSMQAVCDASRRFLDVSILQPASASDYLCFVVSDLCRRLDEGLIDNELCLFGDNAYVNKSYLATPYSNVGEGSKDNYNFFHSQLRINIECAFGILVNRFRLLRKPLSSMIAIDRITALVLALCRLHNWCLDQHLHNIPIPLTDDPGSIMDLDSMNNIRPVALLNGGHHSDDVDAVRRQILTTNLRTNNIVLPREKIHDAIQITGFTRPT
jgi:hypothetical protein